MSRINTVVTAAIEIELPTKETSVLFSHRKLIISTQGTSVNQCLEEFNDIIVALDAELMSLRSRARNDVKIEDVAIL